MLVVVKGSNSGKKDKSLIDPAVMIYGEASFTEEEYKTWFCQGRNSLLMKDIKIELINRGLVLSKNMKKYDAEHFIFGNIIRETSNLTHFYKILVSKMHHRTVLTFVRGRKLTSKSFLPEYCDIVTGIIFSGNFSKISEYVDLQQKSNMKDCISLGERLVKNRNKITLDPLCVHGAQVSLHCMFVRLENCKECLDKVMRFADDCIIKLGRSIFEGKFHKFYTFVYQNKIFPQDIINLFFKFYFEL
jgi:hypothetical protein